MQPKDIKIAAPTFRVVGSRRKLNEYELRTCQLLVAKGEMAHFTVISEDGQRLKIDQDGRFDGRIKNFDLGGEIAMSLLRLQRYKERELQTLNA